MIKKKKILIIEDEKPMALALELRLKHAGFSTKVAFNGSDGVDILQKETFDLILCDLIMPKMDGFTVLAILKERKLKTPTIVLSNLSHKLDEKNAKAFGAKEYFIKSNTSLETIIEKITELLN